MRTLAILLAAAGLLALGYCAFEIGKARLFQAQEARRFARQAYTRPSPPVQEETLPAPYPETGSAVALLAIPRLGVSTVIVEGAGEPELKVAPGHIPGTLFPGAGGNFAVAGHRDTFFRPLRLIERGDLVVVTTSNRDYHYNVVATEVILPEDTRVLLPAGHETLTLVTCYPFQFVGAAPRRFIVRADCTDCGMPSAAREIAVTR